MKAFRLFLLCLLAVSCQRTGSLPGDRVVASGGTIHRFFDTCPVSPSGKYLAVFRVPHEAQSPRPGEAGEVVVVDLASGKEIYSAPSRGWEMQMGANVQWGATDHDLIYNDVDTLSWESFAVRDDFLRGRKERLAGDVFMVSPDGKYLASYDLKKSRFAQVGYGVVVPDSEVSRNVGPVADDGVYVTDIAAGTCRRIVSLQEIYEQTLPSIRIEDPENYEYYCFQVKWNPQGTRLLTTVQWTPLTGGDRRRAVITMKPDGTDIRTAITPEQWARGGHHINWMSDGERLSMNLNVDGQPGVEIVSVRYDGTELRQEYPVGSGHPSAHPAGLPFFITDAYSGEMPLEDGKSPLRLINTRTQTELTVARCDLPPIGNFEFRVDAHPVWTRDGKAVVYNATQDGRRCVRMVDVSAAMDAWEEQIGHWEEHKGLPVYSYTGNLPFTAVDEYGHRTELPEDPTFLLGNYRIGIIPHVSGMYECLTAERGWARLNASRERPDYGSVESSLTCEGERWTLAGMQSLAACSASAGRRFGTGFASWSYRLPDGVNCTRTLSVRPSPEVNGGDPCFVMDITLYNASTREKNLSFVEAIPLNYVPMDVQMEAEPTLRYEAHTTADGLLARVDFEAVPARFTRIPSRQENTPLDFYPPSWFLQKASADGRVYATSDTLGFQADVLLMPGESRTLSFVVGIGAGTPGDFLAGTTPSAEGRFLSAWKQALPDFSGEEDPVLRREMAWHAHFLEASAKYGAYYEETFVPQGSVYSYHYGDNIAARDLLQALLPACYTHPALAKSALRHALMHTRPDGEIERGDAGYGYVMPTIYQESDPQLYVFFAVGEYLRITGDYAFLQEKLPLSPAEYGREDTVAGVLGRHFLYLRDVIGTGPHGLVKLLNSDWSDSFLHRYSPNTTMHEAESHLNSAMALAVLPGFVREIARGGLDELASAVEAYRKNILSAYLADLEGRPFSPRAYLKGQVFGDDLVCIEPHSYLFAIPEIPAERKREIYAYILPRIADSWGLRTRERSLWGGTPEGEDGGIWFALEYPLLLGVSTFDTEEAWRLLKAFTFDHFAATHPSYWIGQWTAPDELNSSLSRDGLYAFWTGMPDYRLCFQGWCSHPHTWPLYCYLKLKENR